MLGGGQQGAGPVPALCSCAAGPGGQGRRSYPGLGRHGQDPGSLIVPSYGMRYMAKALKTALAEKFPRAPEDEVYKARALPGPRALLRPDGACEPPDPVL